MSEDNDPDISPEAVKEFEDALEQEAQEWETAHLEAYREEDETESLEDE